jgi:G3E family GTPase
MTSASTRERLIPLVVVGGYLGAGMTTLVNHLLAGEHGVRLAVVVNDIGAVSIDADLISAHDGDTYELTNDCICCPTANQLVFVSTKACDDLKTRSRPLR